MMTKIALWTVELLQLFLTYTVIVASVLTVARVYLHFGNQTPLQEILVSLAAALAIIIVTRPWRHFQRKLSDPD